MSSANGYSQRPRPRNHHTTGTTSAASGYVSARPVIALPSNFGRSGRATANSGRPTRAAFSAKSSHNAARRSTAQM